MSNISPIIIPTVGRVVWFYPAPKSGEAGFACNESGGPYAAVVARVWNDNMVNLCVFDANGAPHSRTSVHLVQGDEAAPDSAFCGWMPFQRGQAAKQDMQAKEANSGPRIRSHRDELEQSAAHAIAARVSELGGNGTRIGHEVRQALDALVNYGAKAAEPAGETHASRVLYPAIRNAMEELSALHPGFNDHVNRAWNYLHGAFWSEVPAPASALGLRDSSPGSEPGLVHLPVRDHHREEPPIAVATDAVSAVTEQELAAKAVAPRVSLADIEAAIASEHYFTAQHGVDGAMAKLELHQQHHDYDTLTQRPPATTPFQALSLLTFCVLVLRNGIKIVGVNTGPVSQENFDAEIGRTYAREHAVDQVWPLLGYELRSRLAGA
ncbi:Gp49 family protein [Variovorax sp. NFACC27]|uniref:Gp49 family protein n=1 Tax=unclassified Variovorax TaxID=663243 RepID=UPI0008982D2F|nr:Phage protein (N4 Gp49/phage Sf6 gene 66) family protein [Variovorax sp. NFACC28]SEG78124.1 Phage protein (N4 Gp49/phage Sf6 gene 66) family protein [Variovorax sp. NFACC29]SFC95874.1 Phage protein (N4 Gp49/phage Sf6 gene 66) family protein [Variovorax sp. NFACC26]SFG08997.1 Phage protein (N4 Gp49/phage Sf6 gene 66) family protein [Variovorax sp. NFACC27]